MSVHACVYGVCVYVCVCAATAVAAAAAAADDDDDDDELQPTFKQTFIIIFDFK